MYIENCHASRKQKREIRRQRQNWIHNSNFYQKMACITTKLIPEFSLSCDNKFWVCPRLNSFKKSRSIDYFSSLSVSAIKFRVRSRQVWLEVLNVMDSILFGLLEEGTLWLQYLSFSWIADIANVSVMLKKKTSYCTLQMFQHKWYLSYVLLPSLGYLQRDRSYRKIVSRMIVKVAQMFLFKTHTKIIYIKNRN
jgi:hypothetical protein